MTILAIFTGDGFTKQMYDEFRKEADWEHTIWKVGILQEEQYQPSQLHEGNSYSI